MKLNNEEDSKQTKLATQLGEPAKLNREPLKFTGRTNLSSRKEEETQQIIKTMANLEIILQAIRDLSLVRLLGT